MMKSANLFTASFYIVASTGTYTGTGMSNSPKEAMSQAESRAHEALCIGDRKVGYCSGIAVDGWRMYRGNKLIGRADNF